MCKENLKNDIFHLFYEVFSRVKEEVEANVEGIGLTHLQLSILLNLKKGTITTVGKLSKELGISQGNASSICKKLEQMGYLKRKRNEQDERVVNLSLTEEGNHILDLFGEECKKVMNPILQRMSEESLQKFLLGLQEINENLIKIREQE
ncbi:MAG: MarR family transcriptional regulator [Lachnospiraceae bacterium]|jgi:DNA-binding MarR family transcriptional regulator|nr:MarR family transcriptional regulator [Lachnospiraceae bacterium]